MQRVVAPTLDRLEVGLPPTIRVAAFVSLFQALVWFLLLGRWLTFSAFDWSPLAAELVLSRQPGIVPYALYIGLGAFDLLLGIALLRRPRPAIAAGWVRAGVAMVGGIIYYSSTRDFYGACFLFSLAGFAMLLYAQRAAWAINYGAAFWLLVFFIAPMLIVMVVSFGERSLRGTVTYPAFGSPLGAYLDDYGRFFSRINGDFLYLRIFWRSVWMATLNTAICLLFGYPFAYWIARRPEKYRNTLVFLVMIPFWTNFLVRTYAWMLILRDSGIINNFWTSTLHDLAVRLADGNRFFAWLATVTGDALPLLFNQPAVLIGLFYGFFPFVVLPLYSSLEKLDWSLLEAAADLGANGWYSTTRVLLPLTMPGIVAAAIIVFIPSLGAYVTPDLLGGGKVALLGNLLQQQFMTARDWPFGSAIGFIMMALMLLAIVVYFRVEREN